jgi:hypothetical protein
MTEVVGQNRVEQIRSAGVTAAATLGILGGVSALLVWGWFFISTVNLPPDNQGKHGYQTHPLAFFTFALIPPLLVAMGIRTSIGLFQLKPWARRSAILWAAFALIFSSSVIAFRPYETFAIPEDFVSSLESLKQLLAISFVGFTFPAGAWCLLYFTRKRVIAQFDAALKADSNETQHP